MSERTHSYEIYVAQNGRWERHARFAVNQRDAALEKAKTLQIMPSIQDVKVVHDVFDPSRGKSNASVIYRSDDSNADTPSLASDVHYNDYDAFEDGPEPVSLGAAASPRQRRKVKTGVFTKLFILAVASFIISGMVTWVIALAIAELPELRSWIGRSNYGDILFLIFII